jgi:DNA primase
MARIPESDIEHLKASVSLVRLIEAAGHTLTRQGKDLALRCPLHEGDDTPSCIVTPGKNVWHCFGCQRGGSVIDWVMATRHVSFRHAVELLQADSPALLSPATQAVRTVAAAFAPSADDAALLSQVIDHYHATLQASADAQAYLAQRGLTHPDLIATFRLGYANRTLGYRLPEKNRLQGAEQRGALQRIGLLRASGHEHFAGSLVVPVCDADGNVSEVYGRKLNDNLRPGTPLHLYLPGPHRGVFNAAGIAGCAEVIVCEALLDALTFWCAGYRHVTSAFGVSGFTDELLQALAANGTQRVLIAYDRDDAGDSAADKLAPLLHAHGIAPYRVLFPKGMDANAYALKVGPPEKSLGMVLRQAEPMGDAPALPRPVVIAPPSAPAVPVAIVTAASVIEAPVHATSFLAAKEEPSAEPMREPCSPAPPLPVAAALDMGERDVALVFGDRRYRVRGLEKNLAYEVLKVNVLVRTGERFHVDTLDLYQARARAAFAKQASVELGVEESVLQRDLGQVLLQLEGVQEERITAATKAKTPTAPVVSASDTAAALDLLRDPALIERIVADVAAIGVVGEDSNALVGYLAAVSRKLERPLAILIQSTSAAGKSTLMDALLSLMPEAERVHYSAMTGQSLFYLGEGDLKHKILAIAEEEGVRQAGYALKLLQSQGELTIASTGKDPQTGKLVTEEYRVEGPVMLLLTTTAIDIDEELLNRCLVLTINESREQTEAIHARQRSARTLQGLLAGKQAEAIRTVHRAAQTLLRPVAVVNPYAEALTFRSESTRMRRDHAKYLTLIDAIAFLHQHQRPVKTATVAGQVIEYVEVTRDDIALANRLAHDVLGRSLDALPPQTRRLLGAIVRLVAERCEAQRIDRHELRLGRADVRAVAGVSETQLRLHLERLVEMDYLLVHRGQRGQSFVYELLFDGQVDDTAPQLVGLIDADSLRDTGTIQSSRGETPSSRGLEGEFAGSSRPQRGGIAAGSRGAEITRIASTNVGSSPLVAAVEETAPLRMPPATASHRRRNGAAAAQ